MKLIAGYCMPVDVALRVARAIGVQIGDSEDEILLIENHINTWLYNNGMLHVKTALTSLRPGLKEDGILWMTAHRNVYNERKYEDIEPGDKDMEVKKWLMDFGAEGEELGWICMIDRERITLNGTQPQPGGPLKIYHVKDVDDFFRAAHAAMQQRGVPIM